MGPRQTATNVVRHGVTFEQAKDVFDDQKAIEALDEPSSDEERWRLLGRSGVGILMVIYTERKGRIRIISARLADRRERKSTLSKSKSIKRVVAQRAARSSEREDRENPPLSAAVLSSMKRVAPIKRIRWQLGLSQEEFAYRFEIPIGTLRDWEQGRSQPDRPAQAYLKVIQSQPSAVGRALRPSHKTSASISTLASKALRDPRSLTREDIKNLAASVLTSIGEPVERKRKTR